MSSTILPSKANASKSTGNKSNSTANNSPVTEDELLNKETPIEPSDVLRLIKPTKSNVSIAIRSIDEKGKSLILDYLTETDENIYKIEFVQFRIRDMTSNKTLFEVQRDPGLF